MGQYSPPGNFRILIKVWLQHMPSLHNLRTAHENMDTVPFVYNYRDHNRCFVGQITGITRKRTGLLISLKRETSPHGCPLGTKTMIWLPDRGTGGFVNVVGKKRKRAKNGNTLKKRPRDELPPKQNKETDPSQLTFKLCGGSDGSTQIFKPYINRLCLFFLLAPNLKT